MMDLRDKIKLLRKMEIIKKIRIIKEMHEGIYKEIK